MVLFLVGLGLFDELDMTLRGMKALEDADKVYLEGYTSFFNGSLDELERLCGKEIVTLSRSDIEETPEENIFSAGDVALLVLGDPLVATTHSDLLIRAGELGIEVVIIHNASVYSAVGECGLQLYKFGRTTTIAYPEGSYFPKSPYDAILENRRMNLHTLCLLDVKADLGRFMSVNEAVELLLRMESERIQNLIRKDTKLIGVARLGGDTTIVYGTVEQLKEFDFGGPPHCLIVPAKLHFMEEKMLLRYTE